MNGVYMVCVPGDNGRSIMGEIVADDSTINEVIKSGAYRNGFPGTPRKQHFTLITEDPKDVVEFDYRDKAYGPNLLGNYASLPMTANGSAAQVHGDEYETKV